MNLLLKNWESIYEIRGFYTQHGKQVFLQLNGEVDQRFCMSCSKGVITGMKSMLRLITTGISRVSAINSVVYAIFLNDLDSESIPELCARTSLQ